jgi:hypothetical protein
VKVEFAELKDAAIIIDVVLRLQLDANNLIPLFCHLEAVTLPKKLPFSHFQCIEPNHHNSTTMSGIIPLLAPIYLPGQEPLPPGTLPEEAEAWRQSLKYQKWMTAVPESCPFKVVLAGGMGFALGGFFSLMSATFAYEDPLSRASSQLANQGTKAQTIFVMKEMGRNMMSSGKGFARVGMLYSGVECCIEGVSWP